MSGARLCSFPRWVTARFRKLSRHYPRQADEDHHIRWPRRNLEPRARMRNPRSPCRHSSRILPFFVLRERQVPDCGDSGRVWNLRDSRLRPGHLSGQNPDRAAGGLLPRPWRGERANSYCTLSKPLDSSCSNIAITVAGCMAQKGQSRSNTP